MGQVFQSPQAELDLIEIWCHIARDNDKAADRFLDTVGEKCQMLARHPEMGKLREELAPGLRSFSLGNYVLFYLAIAGGIQIVRVLQGSRDIPSALGL